MSISLNNDIEREIQLHSFEEDLNDSQPGVHAVDDNVTIYLVRWQPDRCKNFILTDVNVSVSEAEKGTGLYNMLQEQAKDRTLDAIGWIYADELDISKLIRKEEK